MSSNLSCVALGFLNNSKRSSLASITIKEIVDNEEREKVLRELSTRSDEITPDLGKIDQAKSSYLAFGLERTFLPPQLPHDPYSQALSELLSQRETSVDLRTKLRDELDARQRANESIEPDTIENGKVPPYRFLPHHLPLKHLGRIPAELGAHLVVPGPIHRQDAMAEPPKPHHETKHLEMKRFFPLNSELIMPLRYLEVRQLLVFAENPKPTIIRVEHRAVLASGEKVMVDTFNILVLAASK